MKLYCAKCEDIYNPKSSRHASIDGAYFGSSFHNILFQVYPALVPVKTRKRYEPKIFGFKVHYAAVVGRWQDAVRRTQRRRLEEAGVIAEGQQMFIEDAESSDGVNEDPVPEVDEEVEIRGEVAGAGEEIGAAAAGQAAH